MVKIDTRWEPIIKISVLAQNLLNILRYGKENAIVISTLAEIFSMSERDIHHAKTELHRAYVPVCASKSAPYGLYLPATYAEALDYAKTVNKTFRTIAYNSNCMIRTVKELAAKENLNVEQLELDLKTVENYQFEESAVAA